MTWDDLRTHLRDTLVLCVDEPSRVGLNWEFPTGDEVQRQYVSPISAYGRPHIQIVSNVVVENALPLRDAMALNARLAIGALCVADGYVLLRAVIPLEGVDVTVLEEAIHNVAHEATQVRIHAVSKPAVVPHAE